MDDLRYTLVMYQPDGTDICMGNVVGRWEADFEEYLGLTIAEMRLKIAENNAKAAMDGTPRWSWYVYLPAPYTVNQAIVVGLPELESSALACMHAKRKEFRRAQANTKAEQEAAKRRQEYERLRKEFEEKA